MTRLGDDRGAVTLFVCIALVGLLAMAGLVVDGGAKVRAVQRADRIAAEAARAAGQSVDLSSVLAGDSVRVDARVAQTAAREFLRAAGQEGSVEVSADGRALVVSTTASVPTVFLGLVAVPEFTVHGRADVSLVRAGRQTR